MKLPPNFLDELGKFVFRGQDQREMSTSQYQQYLQWQFWMKLQQGFSWESEVHCNFFKLDTKQGHMFQLCVTSLLSGKGQNEGDWSDVLRLCLCKEICLDYWGQGSASDSFSRLPLYDQFSNYETLCNAVDKLGGPKAVAEMTGRRARIVSDGRGRGVFTLRALSDSPEMDSLNVAERGKSKLYIWFSTGISSFKFTLISGLQTLISCYLQFDCPNDTEVFALFLHIHVGLPLFKPLDLFLRSTFMSVPFTCSSFHIK